MDVMQSLPLLVMALVMTAALGPSLENTIIAISIPLVPTVARVIRSNTLMRREMPFVDASRAVGVDEAASAPGAPVIRSNTRRLREMPFVEASRAVGMNEFAIAIRHVLPNTLAPLIVNS